MPQVPAVSRTAGLKQAVEDAFSDAGALAGVVAGFEPRDGQRRMADAVASILEDGGTLLAEAGTGTGKTLAYLVPAILSGQRVLVSTGTKNLQEQIYFKDLPALQNALGVPFTATLMKGRSNYLCLQRWEIERERPSDRAERSVFLPIIAAWATTTQTGDRAELRDLPEDLPLWKDIAAEADTCLGSECPRYGDCFITLMRQRAAASDVVIVNHHLLCADASVRQSAYGEVIPSCPTLVVDEAHQLEDVATQYFGHSFSNFRVDDLVRDVRGLRAAPRRSSPGTSDGGTFREHEDVARAAAHVADRSRLFFSNLSLPFDYRAGGHESHPSGAQPRNPGGAESRARYTAESLADHVDNGMALAGALDELEAALALARPKGDGPDTAPTGTAGGGLPGPGLRTEGGDETVASLQRRAGELRDDLRFLTRASDPDFVYYLEVRGRGTYLRASPVDVSRIVRDALFDRMRAIVLTSATLAVDGSFTYVKGRLGIPHADALRVPSEFDYPNQALLYLPRRIPPPKAPGFAEAAAGEIVEIVRRTKGRAFVLFTSYAMLRRVQSTIEASLPYPLLVQGSMPRTELLERFRSTPHAVLLATASFWQGVDVVGDALSCVIIDKLPFASPSDPVTAARIEAVTASGGDAFTDYQVPLAILALQQGLGRLIRHRTDRGVLAILDPRLRTMGYGRRFLASLPPAPVTHDLEAVERFFV